MIVEDVFLMLYSRQSLQEMHNVAAQQARLEVINETIDAEVVERTAQLKASESCTRAILEAALDGIVTIDNAGQVVEFNPAAEKMFGYARGEALGREIADLIIPPALRKAHREGLANYPANQRGTVIDKRIEIDAMRRDGTLFPVELAVVEIRNQARPMYTAYVRDITERHRTDEALRASVERFNLAVRGSTDGLWDWNVLSGEVYYSPRYKEMLGYEDAELANTFDTFASRLHAEERDEILRTLDNHLRERTPYDVVYRMRTRSGEYRWFCTRGQAIWNAEGVAYRMAGSTTDVTQRKQTEAELRRSQRELADFFENAPLGLNWLGPDGKILWVNRAELELLGYAPDEYVGHDVAEFHQDRDAMAKLLARLEQGETVLNCEAQMRASDGSIKDVLITANAFWEDGRVMNTRCFTQDITQRKRAENALRETEEHMRQKQKLEAVGELAGGTAHEFNNLLQAILGYTKYAMHTLSPEQQCYQDLEQSVKAAERAAVLTRQLLTFSRRRGIERKNIDHIAVITEFVKMLRPVIGETIELEVSLDDRAGSVFADADILQQALLNLCVNARDAMPAGGKLTIKSDRIELTEDYCRLHPEMKPGRYLRLIVADTGCGMTPDVKQHIFEPFYTTKGVGKGTGLGLSMVYGVVQQHDGLITVYSEVNVGTVFRIYLPLVHGPDCESGAGVQQRASGGNELILIAEDEPMVRALAVRILEGAGYATLTAADGAQAVELFERYANEIKLVVLDVVMPKLTGREVYEKVLKINPHVGVVFCSGYAPETGHVGCIVEEGLRLVEKPFDPESLLCAVRDVLDNRLTLQASPCST